MLKRHLFSQVPCSSYHGSQESNLMSISRGMGNGDVGHEPWIPCISRKEGYPVLCHSVAEPGRQTQGYKCEYSVSLGFIWLVFDSPTPHCFFGSKRWGFKTDSLVPTVQECPGMFRLTTWHGLLFCPHYAVPLILPVASLHLIYISSPCLAWRSSPMPLSACCSGAPSCMSKRFLGNGAGAPSLDVRSRKPPAPIWPSGLVCMLAALSTFRRAVSTPSSCHSG